MTVLNTANKLYLGTQVVSRVYLGSVKVWPAVDPFLIDDFNRANGTVQAGAGSTVWTGVEVTGGAGKGAIVGNRLGASAAGGCRTSRTVAPPYEFEFDVPVLPGVGQYIAFWWGIQNPGASYTSYALLMSQGSPNYGWQFRKYIAGVRTTIVTTQAPLAAGDKVRVRQDANNIRFYRYTGGSWVQVMTRNDSSVPPQEGPMGFEFGDTVGRVDNFRAGPSTQLLAVEQGDYDSQEEDP